MALKLSIEDQLTKARWAATRATPYLARAIWACTWIPNSEVPTAGIDRAFRVYYNPEYIEKCSKEGTLIGEVLHEVLHPLKRNPSREDALAKSLGHCDHSLFNACTDAENDQNIEELRGVALVKERIFPKDLGGERGMPAEELYKLAREEQKKQKGRCSGGSGTGGKPEKWEKGAAAKAEAAGKVGLSEAQVQLLQAQVAQDILKSDSQRPGSVPGGWLRWAKEVIAGPPIPWEELAPARIAYALEKRRGSVASFDRPSRRQLQDSFILPVHRQPIPKVSIVSDTSGSMGETDLGKGLGVVADACLALGKVSVLACDAAPQAPVEVSSLEELQEFFQGGGGTDMPAGIRAAEELTSPDVIVVVTDGFTDWPEAEASAPVIAVLTRGEARESVPSWIEVVEAYEATAHG